MTSFDLEVVKNAFTTCVVYPPHIADDDEDSSDDQFEDALSEVESVNQTESPQATGFTTPTASDENKLKSTCSRKKCSYDEDFIDAIEYAKAFYEIAQFFKYLNMAFAFVAKNLESSCELITTVAKLHDPDSPVSLQQTLDYDEREDHKYGIISCVLWLHRPLEFIIMLFRDLANAPDTESASEIAKRCYAATLGRHHAWPIQQMVNVLLLTLPERAEVIQMMNFEDEVIAKNLLSAVSETGQVVYDRVENLVQRLDLHE